MNCHQVTRKYGTFQNDDHSVTGSCEHLHSFTLVTYHKFYDQIHNTYHNEKDIKSFTHNTD